MSDLLSSLPELLPPISLKLDKLPPLRSAFRIPRLEEKPQNPILEAIKDRQKSPFHVLPKELVILSNRISEPLDTQGSEEEEDIWTRASRLEPLYKNHIASWDTLRPTFEQYSSPSPFITEQAPHVVAAARHRAYPKLFSPSINLRYLSAQDLIGCLNATIVGNSSYIHSWDAGKGRFVATDLRGESRNVKIIMDGMDEVISDSFLGRFLTIGTLLRRIDDQVQEMQSLGRTSNPTKFGFGHVLSTVLNWVRGKTSEILDAVFRRGTSRVVDFWLAFKEIEQIMSALGSLTLRGITLLPIDYGSLPTTPSHLLSHIHGHLFTHIERQSSKAIIGILSYILTITSRPYFQALGQAVGFEGLERTIEASRNRARRVRSQGDVDDYGDEEIEPIDGGDLDLESEDTNEEYPNFVTEEVREAVLRSQRSIKILSAPELGDVPFENMDRKKLDWIWTEKDVLSLTVDSGTEVKTLDTDTPNSIVPMISVPQASSTKYKPELARLALFDLEPGTGVTYSQGRSSSMDSPVASFLSTYPEHLPPLTPTLPLLTDLVFSPIKKQASLLSRASLRLFMDPSSTLHIRAHLVLLRGYLLLTAPAFRARLSAALFSDQDVDRVKDTNMSVPSKAPQDNEVTPWAVGLSPKLIDKARGQWPPYDSDLAFILRRVIMDSLELVRDAEPTSIGVDDIWNEAESRIGFATRPLSGGRGADPLHIEALDFLYIVYKPPRPLTCLITEDILLKYRRVFSFLLRLLRVESVMHILFRVTRTSSELIFPYDSRAQKILIHFRFNAQSFLTSFSSYIYDTAIGGNFDSFLSRIHLAESSPDLSAENYFADVFSLMQKHSHVLDDILSACLLRSVQKAVREVLEAVLASIVEFGVLIGNTRSGHIVTTKAAIRLEDLFVQFKEKRNLLIRALHKVVDKASTPGLAGENGNASRSREKTLLMAPGGSEALAILLAQLTGMKGKT